MELGPGAVSRVRAALESMTVDPRLMRRAHAFAESLARHPRRPLPHVVETSAEREGMYRLMRNKSCGFEELLEAQQQATRARAQRLGHRVLVLHDTTECSFDHADGDEVGWLTPNRPGFLTHHALVVDGGTARPLGVVWSTTWARPKSSIRGRKNRLNGRQLAAQASRESDRWIEGVDEAGAWLEGIDCVHVMDREADNFRLLDHMLAKGHQLVVRLRYPRSARQNEDETWRPLPELLRECPIVFEREVKLSRRVQRTIPRANHPAREARNANLTVRAGRATLQPPRYLDTHPIHVNVVQIREEAPPKGETPIEWLLLTTLPVDSPARVEAVVDAYRMRWLIEDFHKALKTGCMLEQRHLESFEALTTILAFSYPVACELLWMRARAREAPHAPAAEVLGESLLACLRGHPKVRLGPDPSVPEALLAIATLGGYMKRSDPPGWQTLGRGYHDLLAFYAGWAAAKSEM
jgi:hypothetical protein